MSKKNTDTWSQSLLISMCTSFETLVLSLYRMVFLQSCSVHIRIVLQK